MKDTAVCIFAKPPLPGVAKTRLAQVIGNKAAAALARAFLLDTWELVNSLSWAYPVVATVGRMPRGLLPNSAQVWSQGEGDLGERLERILRRALAQFPRAIAIGTDTPGLPASLLEQARVALYLERAVIAPADDGGFYLLGVKECPVKLLSNVAWSDESTFAETRKRLDRFGMDSSVLEPWFDVDEWKDLVRLWKAIRTGAVIAPNTAREIEALQLFLKSLKHSQQCQ